MFSFLTPYLATIKIAGVMLLIISALAWFNKFRKDEQAKGYAKAVAEYNVKAVAAEEAARKKERELNQKIEEARNESVIRQQKIDKLNSDITTTNNRLRNTITNYSHDLNNATKDAVTEYARTLGTVFGECTERYRQMGKNAAGEKSDKMILQKGWAQ